MAPTSSSSRINSASINRIQLWIVRFLVLQVIFTLVMDVVFLVSQRGRRYRQPSSEQAPLLDPHVLAAKPLESPTLERNRTVTDANNPWSGREPIRQVFEEAQVPIEIATIRELPTWEQVVMVTGEHPIVGGLSSCSTFREQVPAVERMLGSAGMFNTGTNLVTHLLKQNCKIPERVDKYGINATREAHGMRWQVPWGKHTPARFKTEHATRQAQTINKEWIMPVVTIRNPYTWFQSMCRNAYTAKWPHRGDNCPNLKRRGKWNNVTVRFADKREEHSDSLAHLWNDWYREYDEEADYPFLMIRIEDLVFHAKETTTIVCECVGGEIQKDHPFRYVIDSAKADSPGHDITTGFVKAWIKYARPPQPLGGLSPPDYEAARIALNEDLMHRFGYEHPPEE